MRTEVARWCRQEGLFAPGDRVVCAVSGGPDSMAMLRCLLSLREEFSISVSAAHFNHRLRGAESERDEAFVRAFCERHGVALSVGSAAVAEFAAQSGKTIEQAAREKRYAFLQSLPCEKLATAHTAEDNAETVLLHLLRGSGLRGLCGIPPRRGRIVRPLLSVTREQILAYLRAENVPWVEDSTNASDEPLRNRLRHQVMPLLYAQSPRLAERLTEQSALLRGDDALLDDLAARLLVPDGDAYAIAPLLGAPDALQKRALRLLVRERLPQDVSAAHIRAMQALLTASNPSAQIALPGGWLACRRYDALVLRRDGGESEAFSPVLLPIPGEGSAGGLKIRAEIRKKIEKFANTPFHFAVKYDMINHDTIRVRPRQSGDRMSVDGRHTKTLKKLLIERKIPRADRAQMAVFADASGTVFAVAGIGADRRYTPSEGEPAVVFHIEPI